MMLFLAVVGITHDVPIIYSRIVMTGILYLSRTFIIYSGFEVNVKEEFHFNDILINIFKLDNFLRKSPPK